MDAVKITTATSISDVPNLFQRLHDKFFDTAYQHNFPWVDRIAAITDHTLRGRLDDLLTTHINDSSRSNVWMAVPELIDWDA